MMLLYHILLSYSRLAIILTKNKKNHESKACIFARIQKLLKIRKTKELTHKSTKLLFLIPKKLIQENAYKMSHT